MTIVTRFLILEFTYTTISSTWIRKSINENISRLEKRIDETKK